MPLTQGYHQQLLDHLFMGTALTQPTNLWVGLSTTTPTATGGNVTEPSGNAYARVSTADADWAAATAANPSVVTNANAVTFPTATGSWGTVTHVTLHTASSGGAVVGFAALTASKAVTTDDTVEFAVGDLDVEMGDADTDTFTGN